MKHILLVMLMAIALTTNAAPQEAQPRTQPRTAGFAEFDRRAKNGERLNIVFFGASLTWGANASDPNLTSYRARIAQKLEFEYPQAHFKFWDAAIGGTGSQLGLFRLERDVLKRQPDLVFLDFSANDDIYSDSKEASAAYEAIVRRLIAARVPVVQVIFPFKWNVAQADFAKMKRRDAHLLIAAAYHTAVGDAISLAVERVKNQTTTLDALWPVDGVHPCDDGYALFASAAWSGFRDGVQRKLVCQAPEKMLFGDSHANSVRTRLSAFDLPKGWQTGRPNLTSAFFDFLMSRWLDDEVICSSKSEVARWKLKFYGSSILLFGEGTQKSGKYRVYIDGAPVTHTANGKTLNEFDAGELARRCGGNVHHAQVIATGLDEGREHTLEIEPVLEAGTEQELRFESICVAGAAPVSLQP